MDPHPENRPQESALRRRLSVVTDRPIAIAMFVLALGVFGYVSFTKLSVDLLPEISYPTLTVRTSWPGAAPEDVEQLVSERVQESLATLPNLVRSTSISRAGASDVLLDFDWGTSMTFAVQDVRERLDGVFLPDGAERPLILRYDPNLDPILRVGVRGLRESGDPERDLIHLRWVAENQLKRELESMEGVAAVQVRGGLEEEVRIVADPYKLAARGLDVATVATRLAQENLNASGGAVREGSTEYLVRTLNEFESTEEIADLALVQKADGASVRVRDVASVERGHARREVVTRLGGDEAVEIAIYREAGANIVQLAERVDERLFGTPEQQAKGEELATREAEGGERPSFEEREKTDFLAFRLREDVEMEVLSDQSTFIRSAVNDVRDAAIVGSLLAVFIIWLFLRRLAGTFIIGVSIPISVIVTFAPMFLFGVSLNIMSLGGLALGVGMLVDNAIVVLESIHRCREEGDDLRHAAVRGMREVGGAVTASTLTTIAVFAPIVFVTGIAGQLFGDQALTVVTALSVSLLVAVLFIPMLASRKWLMNEGGPLAGATGSAGGFAAWVGRGWWGGAREASRGVRFEWSALLPSLFATLGRWALFLLFGALRLLVAAVILLATPIGIALWPLARAFDAVWGLVARAYERLLRGALAQPIVVVLAAGLLLWLTVDRARGLGGELLPEIHQGEFTCHVQLETGTPLETTDEVLDELDRRIREIDGVQTTALTVGIESDTLSRDIEGPNTARLTVRLDELARTPRREDAIASEARDLLLADPAIEAVEIRRPTPFALDAPVAVEIKGRDLEAIGEVADTVYERLAAMEELVDVRSSKRPGNPELLLRFDRDKTLEYGVDIRQASTLVRDSLQGNVSTRYSEGNDRIDMRVIGDEIVLSNRANVLDLVVNPTAETPVTLRSVATASLVQGPAEIRRIGNTRGIVVTAEGRGLDLGGLTSRIEAALADLRFPEDVFVELGGQKREMDEAQSSMRFALLLAVFLVYVVMASQFESLVQPLVILLTVPLAGVGVVLALDALGMSLSVVVFIGLIMLAGIVVNNAIVLVDRINQERARGFALTEAVVRAGRARLRPILMTTATTALGLLPMTGWLAGVPVVGELGSGEGAEMRAPMAVTVIAGLLASTLLTLVVIPTAYSIVARVADALAPAPGGEPAEPLPEAGA